MVVSMSAPEPTVDAEPRAGGHSRLTPGVRGMGLASLLSDLGHKISNGSYLSEMHGR